MRLGTWTREAFLPYLLFCMWKTKSFPNLEKVTVVLRKKESKRMDQWLGSGRRFAIQRPDYQGPGGTKEAGIDRCIRIRFQYLRPCGLKYTQSMLHVSRTEFSRPRKICLVRVL